MASVGADIDAEERGAQELSIQHNGERLGRIRIALPARNSFRPDEQSLVEEVAAQAGLLMSNAQLAEDLTAKVEQVSSQAKEISASRQRMASVAQDERRRLERDLHDGAQARLLSVSAKLRELSELVRQDPDAAASFVEELGADVEEATEELRGIARGLFPSILVDLGLAAALKGVARRSRIPVTLVVDDMKTRAPQEVEAAAYFCCVEAIQNAIKHSQATSIELSLKQQDGALIFTVADDGVGFDQPSTPRLGGLQNMSDRVEALGGTLKIGAGTSGGTSMEGKLPLT